MNLSRIFYMRMDPFFVFWSLAFMQKYQKFTRPYRTPEVFYLCILWIDDTGVRFDEQIKLVWKIVIHVLSLLFQPMLISIWKDILPPHHVCSVICHFEYWHDVDYISRMFQNLKLSFNQHGPAWIIYLCVLKHLGHW